MDFPEYDQLDATELAQLISKGEVSSSEVLEAAIERAESRNPQLNAIVHPLYERARSRVKKLSAGPLHGVPFLLKDLKAQMKGTPTSDGNKLTKDRIAEQDSLIVERFENAGLQTIGKSSSPEFGIMGITEPKIWGPCKNPWDLTRTPGGSSGGSASAVAARIVPIAHAGDGGGSIRIPASACGLFGLKATRGRVSQAPFRGESWGGFVQEGVVSRSVRDAALCLDLIDEITPGEPYAAPYKSKSWTAHLHPPQTPLRIAFTKDTLYAGTTHPEWAQAVEDTASLLVDLGHEVEENKPTFPREELIEAYFYTVACGVANFVEDAARYAGRSPRSTDFEEETWMLAQIGWSCSGPTLTRAQGLMHRASREVARFFQKYDLFVSTVHAEPPVEIGALSLTKSQRLQLKVLRGLNSNALLQLALKKLGTEALARTPNTQLFNQTGQPAMSVPLAWSSTGLPIGIQVAAPFGEEGLLFQLATQLEEAKPWSHMIPTWLSSK